MTDMPALGLVDFHCHLDLYPNYHAAITAAEDAKVYTLSVTTTPKAWPRNKELTQGRRYVHAALGLHPQLVSERSQELSEWEHFLPEARFVGEVGLDSGPRFYKSLDLQKHVFRRVLECCSVAGDKILSVHSIRSVTNVLDMIESFLPAGRGKVVLHWFTGTRAEARRAISLGCYFSINEQMAGNQRGQSLISDLPSTSLLTETDGPFTMTKDKPTTPADVQLAVKSIARIRNETPEKIRSCVASNLGALLA